MWDLKDPHNEWRKKRRKRKRGEEQEEARNEGRRRNGKISTRKVRTIVNSGEIGM
jgi:hypothetical protein